MLGYWVFIIACFYLVNCRKVVYKCKTPNAEDTICVSLFSCPILMKSLGSLEPSAIAFVEASICLGYKADDFMVCCGTLGNYTHNPNQNQNPSPQGQPTPTTQKPVIAQERIADSKEAHRQHVKKELLPSRKYCGLQQTDDRFYNETETALDEFPWLVFVRSTALEFDIESPDKCSGVLISDRYVLTDAYCGWEATVITLGQYNIGLNVSCVNNTVFQECTEHTVFRKVEEKIRSGNGAYDFILLRFDKAISYSDFIRPICLPVEGSLRSPSQKTLTFSGWGAGGPQTIVKRRLHYNIIDDKGCYDIGIGLEGNIKFANVSLACLIPKENNTDLACYRQHGGPLMYSYKHQWFADGIIVDVLGSYLDSCSSGYSATGVFITPGLMEWILDNIRD